MCDVIALFSASLRATATGNFESKGSDKVGEVSGRNIFSGLKSTKFYRYCFKFLIRETY